MAVLKEGNFFGESALLFQEKRNASVRALTYMDLYVLTKEVLDEIQEQFEDFKEMIQKTALKRKIDTQKSIKNNNTKSDAFIEKQQIIKKLKDQSPELQFSYSPRNPEENSDQPTQEDNFNPAKKLVASSIQSGINSLSGFVNAVSNLRSSSVNLTNFISPPSSQETTQYSSQPNKSPKQSPNQARKSPKTIPTKSSNDQGLETKESDEPKESTKKEDRNIFDAKKLGSLILKNLNQTKTKEDSETK